MMILKTDASKAHRRIKVLPKDHRYICAEIGKDIYVNQVGTYGVASAQWYWGRMAALILRLLYSVFPDIHWAFVFVDDFAILLPADMARPLTTAILLFLAILGLPIAWHKNHLGRTTVWLGFTINVKEATHHITPEKLMHIVHMFDQLQKQGKCTFKELEQFVGLLNWAFQAFPALKPLLFFFYRWLHQCPFHPTLPRTILRFLGRLKATMTKKPTVHRAFWTMSQGTGATDAGARGSENPVLGGWWSRTGTPRNRKEVHWFMTTLDRRIAPWLPDRGGCQKIIGPLEMLATHILTRLVRTNGLQGPTTGTGTLLDIHTDNQGNAYNLLDGRVRHSAKKQGLAPLILLEMVDQEHEHALGTSINHVHREFNKWADDLTNGLTSSFSPDLRLHLDLEHQDWDYLRTWAELLEVGTPGHDNNNGQLEPESKTPTSQARSTPYGQPKQGMPAEKTRLGAD